MNLPYEWINADHFFSCFFRSLALVLVQWYTFKHFISREKKVPCTVSHCLILQCVKLIPTCHLPWGGFVSSRMFANFTRQQVRHVQIQNMVRLNDYFLSSFQSNSSAWNLFNSQCFCYRFAGGPVWMPMHIVPHLAWISSAPVISRLQIQT